MIAKSITTKFISAFLIIAMILPSVLLSMPKNAQAIPVEDVAHTAVSAQNSVASWASKALHAIGVPSTVLDTGLHVKDFAAWLLKQALMLVAKAVLARITQATINWINSDFHGAPLFVENPESFFKDIGKFVIRRVVDIIGYDTFRFPFGPQTALNVINSYKRQLEDNAQYSLSKVINDPYLVAQWRNDFNYGGWNGFLINTQYPQNNYIGFQGLIHQNLASQLEGTLQAPAQKIQSALQQGMGFLSPQICETNPKYNNGINEFRQPTFKSTVTFKPPTYDPAHPENNLELDRKARQEYQAAKEKEKATWTENNTCPGGLKTTTPGSVAANRIMTAITSDYRQSELAASLGNSLSAIFDALINQFLDKGLTALASAVSPSPSDDNWSYNGNSLGGSGSYGTPTALSIPQNVSATVGQITSAVISGGTMPYIIQTKPNEGIAKAQILTSGSSGPRLAITGVAPGQTSVIVQDSSAPVKSVAIQIAINAFGAFVVTPRNIVTSITNPITASVSGGKEPYTIQEMPNPAVATAVFEGTSLIIAGIGPGQTSLTMKDSSSPQKIVTVPIVISGAGDLIVPQNISVGVGQTLNTAISGGTAPYIIESTMTAGIAEIKILGENISTKGTAAGQTTIILKDSSYPPKITTMNITVVDVKILQVIPQNISANVGQAVSTMILGGTTPYLIQTRPDTTIATTQIWNSSIVITGVGSGQTSVVVRDSTEPNPQTVIVPITIGALNMDPQALSFGVGQITSTTISGGKGPYFIETDPVAGVATAEILPINGNQQNNSSATLRIIGKGLGQTSVVVRDSSTPPKTIGIQIVIN